MVEITGDKYYSKISHAEKWNHYRMITDNIAL